MGRRSKIFVEKLWEIEAESAWRSDDLANPDGGKVVLFRYLDQILEILKEVYPEIDTAYAAISGVDSGIFTPVAALGRELSQIHPSHSHDPNTTIAYYLIKEKDKHVIKIENPNTNQFFKGSPNCTSKIVVKLNGYGELFGFFCCDSFSDQGFNDEIAEEFSDFQPVLSRMLAESVFSLRLWGVALSFDRPDGFKTIDDLYEEIADRALRAFAACGVVVRRYDSESDRLPAVAISGPHIDDDLLDHLIEENSSGEEVTRLVFQDSIFHWTVGMLDVNGSRDPKISGVQISKELENSLRKLGIHAYCVIRLQTGGGTLEQEKRLGTLSFFHRHQRRFSWRDLALAKTLAQRSADLIALFEQTAQLRESLKTQRNLADRLTEANARMLTDSAMMTRVEVVQLLSHDLGHKAIRVQSAFERYEVAVKKALRENRSFNSISTSSENAADAIEQITESLSNVNQLFSHKGGVIDEIEFNIKDSIEKVFDTLEAALSRANCNHNVVVDGNLTLFGSQGIFEQVLFNLVINSIDAQRSRKASRKNTIHVHANREQTRAGDRIIIRFWDEGPGINKSIFPNPNDIFNLGATSKEEGTGRGLPISRNLLSNYFGGDMSLEDATSAMFSIVLSARRL